MSNRPEENTSRFEKEPNRYPWMNEKRNTWNSKVNGSVKGILDKAEGRISELEKTFEEHIQNEGQWDQEVENIERLKGNEDKVRISNSSIRVPEEEKKERL